MKKCPFCAEEIQLEAIKCKHCGGSIEDIKTQELYELEQTQITKGIYWATFSLCQFIMFSYWILDYFIYSQYLLGIIGLTFAISFYFVAPYIWEFGNELRAYAVPDFYLSKGFFDAIGKRFFWSYGPQTIGMFGFVIVFFIFFLGMPVKPKDEIKIEEPIVENTEETIAIRNAEANRRAEFNLASKKEAELKLIENNEIRQKEREALENETKIAEAERLKMVKELEASNQQESAISTENATETNQVNISQNHDTEGYCSENLSKLEKTLCSNKSFIDFHEEVNSLYANNLQHTQDKELLEKTQQFWLNNKSNCLDESCLNNMYQSRIFILKNSIRN